MGNWFKQRAKEPSTQAGIATVAVVASTIWPQYALILQGLAGLFGVGAVVTKEPGSSDSDKNPRIR